MDPAKPKSFPFRPGMSASADIETTTHENRLVVPINAVTTRDKNDSTDSKDYTAEKEKDANGNEKAIDIDELEEVVFVVQKDGTVRKIKVRTDIQDINYIEVLSGLKEGDEVVTGPYEVVSKTLKNKAKVKVVPKSELFEKKK
jgi:HlyD family secretion protein